MAGVVLNAAEFGKALDKEYDDFKLKFRVRIRLLLHEGMIRMLARTPVNTGQAIMNYVATAGSPFGGVKETGKAVEATNKLSLGAEQLRDRHATISLATLASVDLSNLFTNFYIANNAPNISGLEYGELPLAPYTPRSPSGMFRVTVGELFSLLSSGKI